VRYLSILDDGKMASLLRFPAAYGEGHGELARGYLQDVVEDLIADV
jgi:hypothetical protein